MHKRGFLKETKKKKDSVRYFQARFTTPHSLLEMGRNSEFPFAIDGHSPPF